MKLYHDIPIPRPKGPGGRTADPILNKVTVYTELIAEPGESIWRCSGAIRGCSRRFPDPRQSARVFKHAESCEYLDSEVRQEVSESLAHKAPSEKKKALQGGREVTKPQ